MRFYANGTYDVTWDPFEAYRDYWGDYTFDLNTGEISLTQTGGNYVPADVDGEGSFQLDASGDLILESIWLGTSMDGTEAVSCGHRFR